MTWAADERLGRANFGEPAVGRGRDAVFGAEILGEAFRGFQLGGLGAWSERLDAGSLEPIDEPRDQRCLGPNNDEFDGVLRGKFNEAIDILRADQNALRLGGDARVAGGAVQFFDQGRGRDRPTQRVFSPTRSDDQNFHPPPPFFVVET